MTTTDERAGRPSTTDTDVVEMAWDPITRIVGSLGIYAKIDFKQKTVARVPQHVVDLPRLQHLHEGQGPARRALHHQPDLRHLRRQPRDLLGLQPEHGLRRRSRRTSASGSSTSARPPSTCSTTTSSRRTWSGWTTASGWSRRPTPACSSGPTAPRRRTPATTATGPSATSCARSTRSRATSTARRCRSAATRARCSA